MNHVFYCRIVESKNADYPAGAHMYGVFGWRTHTIFDPKDSTFVIKPYILPSFGTLPLSLGLGHLGMPGNTAYFGFLDICKPKQGEVVVVSGAAGSVGNLVGQIAKIKGCTVIGIVGSDEKCDFIKKECGYDHAINYKKEKVGDALKKIAPKGVDCYFDNVGGEISSQIIEKMAEFGRISICGAVSVYNLPPENYPKVPVMQPTFVQKQLKMEGFHVKRFANQWFEGLKQLKEWTEEGKIKYHETTIDGFENTPQTLIDVLNGKNTGKAVIKV